MCNRYRLKAKPDELIELFDLNLPDHAIDSEYFPGKPVPVVVQHDDGRTLAEMTWGFPPFKGKRPINNTRSETAAGSRYWKRHLARRCVFPLTEAIEWQHQVNTDTGELRKVPHAIRFRDGRIGAVAGIYTHGEEARCCSMMTCRANQLWSTVHNAKPDDPRMVCFLLDHEAIESWLDPSRPFDEVEHLLQPIPDELDLLAAQPLGRR